MLKSFRRKAIAGVAACLVASTAFAQHAGKGHGHDNEVSVARGSDGQLRALSPEEARELVAGMARFVDQSDVGLKWTPLAAGGWAVDLDDRFQSVSLARVAADGSVVLRCVGGEGEALHFLTSPALERLVAAKRRPAARIVFEEK